MTASPEQSSPSSIPSKTRVGSTVTLQTWHYLQVPMIVKVMVSFIGTLLLLLMIIIRKMMTTSPSLPVMTHSSGKIKITRFRTLKPQPELNQILNPELKALNPDTQTLNPKTGPSSARARSGARKCSTGR